ncbi:hypothetical protein B0H21DRAFT_886279 [Amylocystis lapponica]|nr:hypothetical protein B0H21DRAFT_886279 [Amylocystis lapponica]
MDNRPNRPPPSPSSPHSSSSDSPSAVKMPSPLNPSSASQKRDFPTIEIQQASPPFTPAIVRSRGASVSTIRPSPNTSQPISRVTSSPLPASVASSFSSLGFDPQHARSRSSSTGDRGSSVSPLRDLALTWRHSPEAWRHPQMPVSRPWQEKKQKSVPPEQTEGWIRTRERVAKAAVNVLGTTADVVHEALLISVDVLEFAPLPGLHTAARTLLGIWDALQAVDINRLACLRLTERCATILLSVREEIAEAGDNVGEELLSPIARLVDSYTLVLRFLQKQNHRPFLKRYLKREELHRSIQACDNALNDALGMFSLSIQVRILKQVMQAEEQRQADTAALVQRLLNSSSTQTITPAPNTLQLTGTEAGAVAISLGSEQQIRSTLHALVAQQSEHALAHDTADLRQLMRAALAANNDAELLRVLQVGRDEMPEAIKALQRALESEVAADQQQDAASPTVPDGGAALARRGTLGSVESRHTASSGRSRRALGDTLDREFIETGIDALRRLSGAEVALPSWTITRYEVDREEKIGIGFFSDVYRGTWRGRTVAIKVLAETTSRQLFVHEATIWKSLQHANVLELLGASSASSDPPWFFVSPYYKHGSVVTYLKGLPNLDGVDLLKMIHEIAKGMGYLHDRGVLHGDLKAANVLVDDKRHCVISDFGQSEIKSEAYRISGLPLPHGTLRWQAPELMAGQSELTRQIDVYAFAICCIEVLTKGSVPWPMADDDAVRHFVLKENMRPEMPLTRIWSMQLAEILGACWHRIPSMRPSFAKIDQDVQQLRQRYGAITKDSPRPPRLPLDDQLSARESPDMHPVPLPPLPPDTIATDFEDSSRSSDVSYQTANSGGASTAPPTYIPLPSPTGSDPFLASPRTRSRASSLATPDSLSADGVLLDFPGYESPVPQDEQRAELRNERRYRMLLQHEFHPSLTLPLWTPSPIALGAVGYYSKSTGEFVTLFNSFKPGESPDGLSRDIPSLYGYGRVPAGSQRQDKRNVAKRGMAMIQGWLKNRSDATSSTVSRRYTSPLRAGHKAAHLFTESTVYRYVEDLTTPKKWFKANVDHILDLYGATHRIQREDLYLVIGALEAQDYALFVSHSHPDGQVNFNVYAAPRSGQPWGHFSTTTDLSASLVGGPVYADEPVSNVLSASKVSAMRGPWDTVLLARLRFRPDGTEPTSQ